MSQPNILLLISDHVAWYQHQAYEEYHLNLPAWETFKSQSLVFPKAYSVSPLCTPARASMMTGQYPSKHGMRWNTESKWGENLSDFRDGQKLYSDYLKQAGYHNAYIGKWHCGGIKIPCDFGIEGWSEPHYGQPYKTQCYRDYLKEHGLPKPQGTIESRLVQPINKETFEVGDNLDMSDYMDAIGVMDGPAEVHHDHFVSRLVVDKLNELKNLDQPWSLVASFWGPHHAYFPTRPFANGIDASSLPEYPSFSEDLGSKPFRYTLHNNRHRARDTWSQWKDWQNVLARAFEQQQQTDHAIGQVLKQLDDMGQAENTIVIWVADHGDALGSHGGLWNKASSYPEEVARIPLGVRWPSQLSAGVNRSVVSNMDVTATMLRAAGMGVPDDFDSRSLLDINCDDLVCEHNGHDTDLVQRILISGNLKYVACVHDGDEFYDLENDPFELNNLINSELHRQSADICRQKLIKHIDNHSDRIAFQLKQWLQSQLS